MNKQSLLMIDFVSVLKKHYSIDTPVDVKAFVKHLGGTIEETGKLPYGVSGRVIKTGADSFKIQVRSGESSLRQNFTIAHEIGHLFFDMHYIVNPDKWNDICDGSQFNRTGDLDNSESLANSFAAELLMPQNEFVRSVYNNLKNGFVDVDAVANHFNVSCDAVSTRAKWLGLVAW